MISEWKAAMAAAKLYGIRPLEVCEHSSELHESTVRRLLNGTTTPLASTAEAMIEAVAAIIDHRYEVYHATLGVEAPEAEDA